MFANPIVKTIYSSILYASVMRVTLAYFLYLNHSGRVDGIGKTGYIILSDFDYLWRKTMQKIILLEDGIKDYIRHCARERKLSEIR